MKNCSFSLNPLDLYHATQACLFKLTPSIQWFKQQAIIKAQLDDFGNTDEMNLIEQTFNYQTELQTYDPSICPIHYYARREWFVRILTERLKIVHNLKLYPQIKKLEIRESLCIMGLPRTGTTLLYNLLALDSTKWCYPKLYDCVAPSLPVENSEQKQKDFDRIIEIFQQRIMPQMPSVHYFHSQEPEECIMLFFHMGLDLLSAVTGKDPVRLLNYLLDENTFDYHLFYEYHRVLLQLLCYRKQRNNCLFKCPFHLLGLKSLVSVYPNCKILMIHRDPLETVPSLASLMSIGSQTNYIDLNESGRKALHVSGLLADLIVKNEQESDASSGNQFYHIQYKDLIQNPVETMKNLFSFYQFEYTSDYDQSLKYYLKQNPQHKHGQHKYSLEKYGLSKQEIQLRFYYYCKLFNISNSES
ncbi:unnamed protein product [Didymodactylos carnosus]|uniref:Sulfotransferase n=1 Tax=Didymodactylos carnosus TaxID=1234261 RepID=A0A814F933_9BILA|nr:unnamed protein product [Didymodactylos carnosus]CAF3751147.1 unnamed protein product [Didymodactylos carnosus]